MSLLDLTIPRTQSFVEAYLPYLAAGVGAVLTVSTLIAVMKSVPVCLRRRRIVPPVDLRKQSEEIQDSDGARKSRLGDFPIPEEVENLHDVMARGLKESNDGPCLGRHGSDGQYHWISYSVAMERAKNLASGLMHIGMKPGQDTCIGIYAKNCVEWVLTQQACYNQSAVPVPLYDTLGPHACSYIINRAEIGIVVCDAEEKVRSLLNKVKSTPSLKQIIVANEVSDKLKTEATELGIQLHRFTDIENIGKQEPVAPNLPHSDDLALICFTSGTTGEPKGVMITHYNLIAIACSVIHHLGEHAPNRMDVVCSFLPLAHIFEQFFEVLLFMKGSAIAFSRGDRRLLVEDFKAIKPTVTLMVPRVLNKIYDQVQAKASDSKATRLLLKMALKSKMAEVERGIVRKDGFWDKLVLKKIREILGGRLRLIITGSAPIAEDVLNFVRCTMGCVVIEGYGQTETSAPSAAALPGDCSAGHVGPPVPGCQIKLVDVPEMGYFSSNNQGEICVKGPNVFKGYFKNPEQTGEAIDTAGWLHTGDIGMWLPNGTLKVVDRKKNIFKLSQGEYIAPERIEIVYLGSKFISQIFIHGESLKSCLVAIVVPDEATVTAWCQQNNITGTWTDMCSNKAVKEVILNDMITLGQKAGLKSFEQVRDIYLCSKPFTEEDDLLTPTMKAKRRNCSTFFKKQIEDMYKLLP